MPEMISLVSTSPKVIYIPGMDWLHLLKEHFMHSCIIRSENETNHVLGSITFIPEAYSTQKDAFKKYFIYGTLQNIQIKILKLTCPVIYATTDTLPASFYVSKRNIEISDQDLLQVMRSCDLKKTASILDHGSGLNLLHIKQQHLLQAVWHEKVSPCADLPCQIIPGLYLGSKTYTYMEEYNIGFVCRLGMCFDEVSIPSQTYPILDSPNEPFQRIMMNAIDIIHSQIQAGVRVYVHCLAGVSRSSSIVLAYLMKYNSMTLIQAWNYTFWRRPIIRPNIGFGKVLLDFELQLYGVQSVHSFWLSQCFGYYMQYLDFLAAYDEAFKLQLNEQ